jgi:hypothetical protein
MEADSPNWMWMDVPAAKHAYRLTYHTQRSNPFWQRSTTTDTEWRFDSAHTDSLTTLPLLAVAIDAGLDTRNAANVGPASIVVDFAMPPGATAAKLRSATLELSWDGGATWSAAAARCADPNGRPAATPFGLPTLTPVPGGSCTARVTNLAGGHASLRVRATDAVGREVRQTIVDAYVVR